MMIRTQIQLTDAQAAAVKARAAAEGRSMADVIRSCVDEALPAQAAADPAERMRRQAITRAFHFDRRFQEQGFEFPRLA